MDTKIFNTQNDKSENEELYESIILLNDSDSENIVLKNDDIQQNLTNDSKNIKEEPYESIILLDQSDSENNNQTNDTQINSIEQSESCSSNDSSIIENLEDEALKGHYKMFKSPYYNFTVHNFRISFRIS